MLVWIAGTGAGTALLELPHARTAMTALGLCWMLWLAWKLFTSPVVPLDAATSELPRELGLVGALLLQWVNPKSWLMALAVIGVFTADGQPLTPLCMAFFLVALPCLGAWALLGRGAARWLNTPAHLRWMNRALALLLVLSSGVALLQA